MSLKDFKTGEDNSDGISDEYDSPQDRKLLRKVDLRTNIGNARIDGLTKDLHISPSAYNTALALYFIAYVTFEVPANIILKRFDPQLWLPPLTFAWGVASVAQGLVTNQAGLFGIRVPADMFDTNSQVLGVTEAGLFPGVIFIFSVYYLRRERHWRVAIFFGGAALAGAFGGHAQQPRQYPGIFAYVIGKMEGVGGKRGWQWIFILEGLLTILISVLAFFFVPTWPQKAKWLTDAERSRLLARLDADSDAAEQEKFAWEYVSQAVLDPLVWGYALLFHGFAFTLLRNLESAAVVSPDSFIDFFFFLNDVLRMTVPPNALASIGIAFGAWLAARTGRRAPLIIGSAVVAIIGYIVLLTTETHLTSGPNDIAGAQYAGVHFAALGIYTGNALLLSWPSENISGQTKRAVGVAMQITIGDLGAVTGVLLYRPAFSAHRFRKPHIIAIGYLTFAIIVASALWHSMASENRRRTEIIAAGKDEVERETKVLLGDREVHWRYRV
ncbi:major facilitator superfamily domain-containing protein [Multifurca ochricompacta]|uniref:Major facilitator superfamily domain-containing protein n=1 Tax=Multifurca ochricompacta TaxID=376703 RepID=A0AAD4M6S8_9AGAM|nr:major facilitator superfamily domain-containing protein [Multifurca ochricompacta]